MTQLDIGAKEDILYWSKRLYDKDLMPSISGNISVRVEDGILISPSGVCLNDMSYDDIVLIDYNGNAKEGKRKPSSEKLMHCEIYSKREDIFAIIHSHNPLITAFAVAGIPIKKPILPDFVFNFDEVPLVPYYCPSSILLADATADYFDTYNAVLLQNHGVVIADTTLQNAFYKLEMLKTYVETYFAAEVLGGAKALSKPQLQEIKNMIRRI